MKYSLYTPADYVKLTDRIDKLTPTNQPLWGKMNAGQMLAHCNVLYDLALGRSKPSKQVNFLLRMLLKPLLLAERPFMKNAPTGPDFKVSDKQDFEKERSLMLGGLEEIYKQGANSPLADHPSLGKLTQDEWGWILWKHTDHHLRQFGV